MQLGCYDFIEKPFAPERLVESVARAINKRRLTLARRSLTARLQAKKGMALRILGESDCISCLRAEIIHRPAGCAGVALRRDRLGQGGHGRLPA